MADEEPRDLGFPRLQTNSARAVWLLRMGLSDKVPLVVLALLCVVFLAVGAANRLAGSTPQSIEATEH
jgi:hypothetical protein